MKKIFLPLLVSALLSATGNTQPLTIDNPVAFYPFNGNANDDTYNSFNGTPTDITYLNDRHGNPESAAHFNGTTSNIDLGNVFNDVFAGEDKKFSISVWVKPEKYHSNNAIFIKSSDRGCNEDQRQLFLRIYEGKAEFEFFSSLSGYHGRYIGGSTSISDTEKWYHIVVTYDGTVDSNNGLDRVKIYVNGEPEQTSFARQPESSLGDIEAGQAHSGIGATLNSNGTVCEQSAGSFKGLIDDLKIFNTAISDCHVKDIFNRSEIIAYYPFNGNANDNSLNRYNGTENNVEYVTDRFGNENSACRFNGQNSNIGLGNVFNNIFAGIDKEFSFSVYVKPGSYNSNNAIFIKNGDSGCNEDERQIIFRIFEGKAEFEFFSSLTGYHGRYIGGSTSISDTDKWYHIVVTYDGSVDSNDGLDRVKIYVDGEPEQTSFARGAESSLGDIEAGQAHSGIGATLNSNGELCEGGAAPFNGTIDDLKIIDKALSECQIQLHFKETPPVITGEAPLNSKSQYLAFPNPTTGYIKVSELIESDRVTVLSLTGQIVDARVSGQRVDLSAQPPGIYFIKIEKGESVDLIKVSKK